MIERTRSCKQCRCKYTPSKLVIANTSRIRFLYACATLQESPYAYMLLPSSLDSLAFTEVSRSSPDSSFSPYSDTAEGSFHSLWCLPEQLPCLIIECLRAINQHLLRGEYSFIALKRFILDDLRHNIRDCYRQLIRLRVTECDDNTRLRIESYKQNFLPFSRQSYTDFDAEKDLPTPPF